MHQRSFYSWVHNIVDNSAALFLKKKSKYCDCREGWHPTSCCSVASNSALCMIVKFWRAIRFCCCDVIFRFLHCVRFCAGKVWWPQNYCLGTCCCHSCLNSPSSFSHKKHPSSKGGWGSHKGQSWHSVVLMVTSVPHNNKKHPQKTPKNSDPFCHTPKSLYLPKGSAFCFSKKKIENN